MLHSTGYICFDHILFQAFVRLSFIHSFYFSSETYPAIKASVSARVVTLTAFLFNGDKTLRSLGTRLSKLESMYGNRVETSCDVLTTLRYVSKPRFGILSYITPKDPDEMELKIEKSLEGFISFLGTHRFSLEETYGDDFDDLIQEIPNPTQLPLKLIDEFLSILRTCGVWCAERAALLLTIKICKLKTREKYERHYLLLSVLYSEMLKICKLCDDAFGELSDREKMTKYAKPKMLRFLSVLLQYKPEHIQDFPVLEQALEEQQPKKNSSPPSEEEDGEEARSKEEAQPPLQPPKEDRPPPPPPSRFRSKSKKYNSYDDPNALCGVIFVQNKFLAQILFHYLKEMSKSDHRFSFLTPQYAVILKVKRTDEGLLNHRKQEEALRRFRMRECNVLISNSLLEVGIDCVRCNLVLAFDVPDSFHTYAHYKVKAKSALSWFLSLCKEGEIQGYLGSLREYASIEKSLVDRCMYKDPSLEERLTSDANNEGLLLPPFTPKTLAHPTLSLKNAILLLNRYCAKLPSDTFTRLTPLASVRKMSENTFLCGIQLPINCPLKRIILGRPMPNETLAKRAAAYAAVLELHKMGEVDHFMNPLGKDGHASYLAARYFKQANKQGRNHHHKKTPPEKKTEDVLSDKLQEITLEDEETPSSSKVSEIKEIKAPKNGEEAKKDPLDPLPRPGTTKRRQYYYKKIASCLKSPKAAAVENSQGLYRLYTLDMHLSCPIPDDQNTRGRKIYPPEDSPQGFGFLVQTPLPPICPFPIYTRSGRDGSLSLSQEQLDLILCFHRYTFSKVLRLEKYPMQFTPERSHNSILMLPLCKSGDTTDIDWEFLERIKEENEKKVSVVSDEDRAGYTFRKEDYMDAVIMPWYRNQDQPQYFYVAEICDHLDPTSDFPGQGFETFSKYYQTKYGIGIQNLEQPLLDVDHTSHRLNFLTPRYVNRKGVALPTSSEETKRNKRENLEQKQILVPELCQIHPFPGVSGDRPLNGLLIADDLRSLIAREMTLGKPVLPQDFVWPPLDFGWTLADQCPSAQRTGESEKESK
ncbi:Endoribonuclease Dicer1, partial [Caligus rogercresseyi]